jgi:hypothetical protein
MYHNPRYINRDVFLGVYSDPLGVAAILFNCENDCFNILKHWSKSGLVSMREGVRESFNLLEGVSYSYCRPYLNETEGFYNLFRQTSRTYRVTHFNKKNIEILEGYQIINSLLAEERITLAEGLEEVSQALRAFNLEEDVNHTVYALFHSVAMVELENLKPKAHISSHSSSIW